MLKKVLSKHLSNCNKIFNQQFISVVKQAANEFDTKWKLNQFSAHLSHEESIQFFLNGNNSHLGHITDPHFENPPQVDSSLYQFYYTVKPNKKPSDAMTSLMTSQSRAVFACQSRQKVIMYRSLQLLLQNAHGPKKGNTYFDQLCSNLTLSEVSLSVSEAITFERTPKIYPHQALNELAKGANSNNFNVNPLLFFYRFEDMFKHETFQPKTGDLITFWNHPNYLHKHPNGLSRFQATLCIDNQYSCLGIDNHNLVQCSDIEASLVANFNEDGQTSMTISVKDLPPKYQVFICLQEQLEQLITSPEQVIQNLKYWENKRYQILSPFKNHMPYQKNHIQLFTTHYNTLKQTFSDRLFSQTECLGISILMNTIRKFQANPTEKKYNHIKQQLLNMTRVYTLTKDSYKAFYYYKCAASMTQTTYKPLLDQLLDTQQVSLRPLENVFICYELLSTNGLIDFLTYLNLTQQANADDKMMSVIKSSTIGSILINHTNIFDKVDKCCINFNRTSFHPLLSNEDLVSLALSTLNPILEHFLGFQIKSPHKTSHELTLLNNITTNIIQISNKQRQLFEKENL